MTEELNIGEAFKRFRGQFKLTKKEVAETLGISPQGYEYESERKNKTPNLKTLYKIAKAYNVSLDYLAGLTDDPRPVNQILAEMGGRQSAAAVPAGEITLEGLQAELAELRAVVDEMKRSLDKIKGA